MKAYFLVEGSQTERKMYPAWLSALLPELPRIQHMEDHVHFTDCYYLISGNGYPHLYKRLSTSIEEVNAYHFDLLVLCLDSDELSVADMRESIEARIAQEAWVLNQARLEIIVQHRCIETWLLANRRVFSRQPQSVELQRYIQHYNVSQHDPEQMPVYPGYALHAPFHYDYLKAMLAEKNIAYTKKNPRDTLHKSYVEALQQRVSDTPVHLNSLQHFFNVVEKLRPVSEMS